jgi:hypothetical protein
MSTRPRRRSAADGFRKLNAEGAGAFLAAIVGPWNALDVLRRAADGDAEAAWLFLFIEKAIKERNRHDGSRLCGACDYTFYELPIAFFVLRANRDNPSIGIATGLCAGCADRGPTWLWAAVEKALRKIIPDLRTADPASVLREGGTA